MERLVPDVSGYVVRPPAAQDATELGRMHCTVWQQTYADSMNPQSYAALSPQRFADYWARTLGATVAAQATTATSATAVAATTARTAVADHVTDGIVGFITVGPPRDPQPPAPYQLWALNVEATHHGTGLAQHLMDEVLGDGPAYLWVAHGNGRAIAFYERHGFTADSTESIDDHDGLTEIRMVRHG